MCRNLLIHREFQLCIVKLMIFVSLLKRGNKKTPLCWLAKGGKIIVKMPNRISNVQFSASSPLLATNITCCIYFLSRFLNYQIRNRVPVQFQFSLMVPNKILVSKQKYRLLFVSIYNYLAQPCQNNK